MPDELDPIWSRPVPEQLTALRHDVAGVRQENQLITSLLTKMTGRMERMELRLEQHDDELRARPTTDRLLLTVREEIQSSNREVLAGQDRNWQRQSYLLGGVGVLIMVVNVILTLTMR